MAQNIYDQQDFFDQYNKLPRSVHGLDGAPEWPTLRRMVGDINGASVLDLGCGLGWFCRWAVEAGAQHVHGVDISEKMLARAATYSINPGITYERIDLESVALQVAKYDLVYSSLTLHYLPNLGHIYAQVAKCLKPGGRFVFSVEHPVMSAPSDASWKTDDQGNLYWPLNHYIDEGLRVTNWLQTEEVQKYHFTVQTYISLLLENGFLLKAYAEAWDELERKSVPDKPESGHRPFFLMIAAQVP